jgi:hypothetical protein
MSNGPQVEHSGEHLTDAHGSKELVLGEGSANIDADLREQRLFVCVP